MSKGDATGWVWEPERLREELEAAGYDVDPAETADSGGGGSLTARRERWGRNQVLSVDAGGRFRGTVTVTLAETGTGAEIATVPVRVVTHTRRESTVGGVLTAPDQLGPVLGFLDALDADGDGGAGDERAEW